MPDVTLLAVSDVALTATARALAISQMALRFGEVLILGAEAPPPGTAATWRRIPKIESRHAYSRFMLHDLAEHVATSHVLCVQWDGYVLDASRWDPAFLEYDYIGAPWPHFSDGMRVGNGGFSLRSRRLINACKALPIPIEAEDVAICRTHRYLLEAQGLRFAPETLARRFAFERAPRRGDEFGFHGAFNMVDVEPPQTVNAMFKELEPGLLNRNEHREILWHAVRRGNAALALTIWRRLRDPLARRR